MKRVKIVTLLLLAVLVVFSGTAFAKMVSGKVEAVDSATNKLTVNTTDAATGASQKADIWINADATFSGAASLADLKQGDEVWVEAEADAQGNWKASKVTKA